MTTGAGVGLIGDWFGTGPDRGIALVFVLAGMAGICLTVCALRSCYYRQLSSHYADRRPSFAQKLTPVADCA
jgi:DHA3 family multidrug efflux protein-like MFS transporter